jgi:hypothetical protein
MVDRSLLAGEKDYPGKATESSGQHQGEDRGDYRTDKAAVTVSSRIRALSSSTP